MVKFFVIIIAASLFGWFFYQGFTGQPYSFDGYFDFVKNLIKSF